VFWTLGAGNSVREIMAGLNGNTNFAMGEGHINNRFAQTRRTADTEAYTNSYGQAMQVMQRRNLFAYGNAESDPKVRGANLDELRARSEDPIRHKEFLMRSSLIESVRKAASIL